MKSPKILVVKHQYYGDARDVAKWSTLARIAKQRSCRIVQIAMLTHDDVTAHGRMRNDPITADPIVAAFFAEERRLIVEDPSKRQIGRIADLGKRFEPPLTIDVISDPFKMRNRRQYFDDVCKWISRSVQNVLAFADPDTGIAIGSPGAEHITGDELGLIWSALRIDSVLTVFQYQQRIKDWIGLCIARFAAAINIEPTMVDVVNYPHVSFLSAVKS